MSRGPYNAYARSELSTTLRVVLIVICALILTSCRTFSRDSGNTSEDFGRMSKDSANSGSPALPSSAGPLPYSASSQQLTSMQTSMQQSNGLVEDAILPTQFAAETTASTSQAAATADALGQEMGSMGSGFPMAQTALIAGQTMVTDTNPYPVAVGWPPSAAVGPVPPPMPVMPAMVDAQGNPLPLGTPPGVVPSAWTPPGVAQPWPQDEFLADGGDLPPFAGMQGNTLGGINAEDTVARFATEDGSNKVQASNRVFIYSPRFASVRQVIGIRAQEQREQVVAVNSPTHVALANENQPVEARTQHYQAIAGVQRRGVGQFEAKQYDGAVSQALGPRAFADGFKPYENFSLIKRGEMLGDEMPLLAKSLQAAIVWSHDQSVQLIIDGVQAAEDVGVSRVHSIYRVESREGKAELRLIKVASQMSAQPGDTIDFTLRFDNVGTKTITQLVLVDSLSTRLEYVPDSFQSSVAATLDVLPNEAGSSTLQWELEKPLPPGEGGIIRFSCRVR